jgi:hypothetical protein
VSHGHPLIEQFCRIPGIQSCQPSFFNQCQRVFRDDVQPMLVEREALLLENAALKEEIAKLKAKRERVPA